MEDDARARVGERKGARPWALCVVSRWWESGKSVFHFKRLKVQMSIYSASQIILSSIISNNTWTLECTALELWCRFHTLPHTSKPCVIASFFFQGSTETLFTWNDMNEVSHLYKLSLTLLITRVNLFALVKWHVRHASLWISVRYPGSFSKDNVTSEMVYLKVTF